MRNTRRDRPAPEEVTAMLAQFHDHVDSAITSACSGRWERTLARPTIEDAVRRLTALLRAGKLTRFSKPNRR